MRRRTLTLGLVALAGGAAFAAPRLLPGLDPAAPDPIPEVVEAPPVVSIPPAPPPPPVLVQRPAPPVVPVVPVVPVRPVVPTTIPELSEPVRVPRNPGHIPELDAPRIVLPEEPLEVECRACGRG